MTNIKSDTWLTDEKYLGFVEDLLKHPKVLEMKDYLQHGEHTCLDHCLTVSYTAYLLAEKKDELNSRAVARGGLLHDFFLYDWHDKNRPQNTKFHGFRHSAIALKNAQKYFDLSEIEQDIIEKHMWPLTVFPPKFKESWLVTSVDKYLASKETLHLPMDYQIYALKDGKI